MRSQKGVIARVRQKSRTQFEKSEMPITEFSLEVLSPRELDVLKLFVAGFQAKEIMAKLNISRGTVNTHTERIYRKLGVNCRAQAVYRFCLLTKKDEKNAV